MKLVSNEIKEIISILNRMGRAIGLETVFRDWCECSAITIANSCDLIRGATWEKREKRYLELIGGQRR